MTSLAFYTGTHQPHWLWRAGFPLFVSASQLARRRSLRPASCRWALDSGGFTELSLHSRWVTPAGQYVAAVADYAGRIGGLDFAAPQDWMCEPFMIERTGLSVAEHLHRTVDNYLTLRQLAPGLPIIPVVQGWRLPDYLLRTKESALRLVATGLAGASRTEAFRRQGGQRGHQGDIQMLALAASDSQPHDSATSYVDCGRPTKADRWKWASQYQVRVFGCPLENVVHGYLNYHVPRVAWPSCDLEFVPGVWLGTRDVGAPSVVLVCNEHCQVDFLVAVSNLAADGVSLDEQSGDAPNLADEMRCCYPTTRADVDGRSGPDICVLTPHPDGRPVHSLHAEWDDEIDMENSEAAKYSCDRSCNRNPWRETGDCRGGRKDARNDQEHRGPIAADPPSGLARTSQYQDQPPRWFSVSDAPVSAARADLQTRCLRPEAPYLLEFLTGASQADLESFNLAEPSTFGGLADLGSLRLHDPESQQIARPTQADTCPLVQSTSTACLELYASAGVDLAALSRVGLGSVCRRQSIAEIAVIVAALARRGLRLHRFGVKTGGLHLYGYLLASADSMAWSYAARRLPAQPGCTGHKNCANCLAYATRWRQSVLRRYAACGQQNSLFDGLDWPGTGERAA